MMMDKLEFIRIQLDTVRGDLGCSVGMAKNGVAFVEKSQHILRDMVERMEVLKEEMMQIEQI
jgi:hypothetical protein